MHTKYEEAKGHYIFKETTKNRSRCSLSPKLHTQVKEENVAQINDTFFCVFRRYLET